jgi:hypothetical protein
MYWHCDGTDATEGQATAWPFLFGGESPVPQETHVIENSRKSRERAETAFSKTQTQFLSLNRILSERDAVSEAREAKTARLKELRLEKETADLAAAAAAPVAKKKAKR